MQQVLAALVRRVGSRCACLASGCVLVLAMGTSACDGAPEPSRPNVVLLIVDTLRAENVLGSYERETAPNMAALGERGAVFERAYASSPWTMPSVATMLTGLHPESHGVVTPANVLPERVHSLAETLRSEGYATAAVVSHKLIGTRYDFDQGFEVFDEEEAQGHKNISTEGVTRRAQEQLERLQAEGRPFFLLVHYFDPHAKYQRHPEYGFSPEGSVGRLSGGETPNKLRSFRDLEPEEVGLLRDRYDEEVAHTDAGIGRLMKQLDEQGLAESTYVALVADHGEEFWDHGRLGHTTTLYEELIHVPFLLSGPGLPAGQRFADPVSLAQLKPTLLDLLGVDSISPLPEPSLRLLVEGQVAAPLERPVFASVDYFAGPDNPKNTVQRAVVLGRHKLLVRENGLALFDLEEDPRENRDLAKGVDLEGDSEVARRVRSLLDLLQQHRARSLRNWSEQTQLSPEDLQGLEALGYAGDDE